MPEVSLPSAGGLVPQAMLAAASVPSEAAAHAGDVQMSCALLRDRLEGGQRGDHVLALQVQAALQCRPTILSLHQQRGLKCCCAADRALVAVQPTG